MSSLLLRQPSHPDSHLFLLSEEVTWYWLFSGSKSWEANPCWDSPGLHLSTGTMSRRHFPADLIRDLVDRDPVLSFDFGSCF